MLRRAARAIAMLAVLASDAPSRADAEVVELRYDAPAGCPARSEFEAEILERTPNVQLGAPARRVFAVTIEPTADGFHGALVVDRVADKELSAQRCDDLATALALVTALAIDPTAAVAARPRAPRPPAPAMSWSLDADIAAMVEAGVAPGAMFAAAIEARARSRGYQLEVAAIAGRDTSAEDDVQQGALARFTWLAARLSGCRVWLARGFAVDGCGHVELGAVRATGQRIINQRDLTRLWLAAGLHAGGRVPIGARVFGLLQLGAALPIIRDRYIFAPNVAIHDTPFVTGWVVVGVGLQFR
jgi:hypothetical protein